MTDMTLWENSPGVHDSPTKPIHAALHKDLNLSKKSGRLVVGPQAAEGDEDGASEDVRGVSHPPHPNQRNWFRISNFWLLW